MLCSLENGKERVHVIKKKVRDAGDEMGLGSFWVGFQHPHSPTAWLWASPVAMHITFLASTGSDAAAEALMFVLCKSWNFLLLIITTLLLPEKRRVSCAGDSELPLALFVLSLLPKGIFFLFSP